MVAKIKTGDKIIVLSGKDKGKQGDVTRVIKSSNRVMVAGINMVKRHTKPSQESDGGIIEKEASIHISNVSHIDPKDSKATRIGIKIEKDGKKVRFAKRSGEIIS